MRYFEKSLFLFLFLLIIAGPLQAQTTGIYMETWDNRTLADAQELANNPNLLGPSTDSSVLTNLFEVPPNKTGNFVRRLTACFTPQISGTYYWYIVANRKAKLWLQLNTLSFVSKTIHAGSQGNPPPTAGSWDYPSQTVPGQRGFQIMSVSQRWCVMAVQIEDDGDGINHLAVGWQKPGTAAEGYLRKYERPVPASYFNPVSYPPPPPPMTMTFTSSMYNVQSPTEVPVFNWSVQNSSSAPCTATSVPLNSNWSGQKSNTSGSQPVPTTTETFYQLTCIPANGNPPSYAVAFTVDYTVNNQITLAWNPVTTLTDGSPLTIIPGYRLYYGLSPGNYTGMMDVGNTTSFTLTSVNFPVSGVYYFVVTCYNPADSLESGPSNMVSRQMN